QTSEESGGIDISAAIANAVQGKACDGEGDARLLGFLHCALELAPEGLWREQTGIRIDGPLALERFQGARQLSFEGMQARERKDALDKPHGIAFDVYQIGEAFVVRCSVVQHANR